MTHPMPPHEAGFVGTPGIAVSEVRNSFMGQG